MVPQERAAAQWEASLTEDVGGHAELEQPGLCKHHLARLLAHGHQAASQRLPVYLAPAELVLGHSASPHPVLQVLLVDGPLKVAQPRQHLVGVRLLQLGMAGAPQLGQVRDATAGRATRRPEL